MESFYRRLLANATNPSTTRIIRRIILLLTVCYLGALILLGVNQLRHLNWIQYLHATAAGLLLYPISLLVQGIAWSLLVGLFTRSAIAIRLGDLQVFASSQLMKRLPGGAWYIAGRAYWYRDRSIDVKIPVLASAIELSILLTSSAAGFTCLTYFHFPVVWLLGMALAVGALAGGMAGTGVFFVYSRMIQKGDGAGRPASDTNQSALITFILLGLLYFLPLLVGAEILYLFSQAGGDSLTFFDALRTWALIAGAGTLVAVVPFGLGLRDLTMASLLSFWMNPSEAVVIAVFFRLLFMVGDVVWSAPLLVASRWLSTDKSLRA